MAATAFDTLATKADVARLEDKMATKADLYRVAFGVVLASTGLTVALLKLL